MMRTTRLQTNWLALLALCIGFLPAVSHAEPPEAKPTPPISAADIDALLAREGGIPQSGIHERSNDLIRMSFREVVRKVNRATVRVLADDQG